VVGATSRRACSIATQTSVSYRHFAAFDEMDLRVTGCLVILGVAGCRYRRIGNPPVGDSIAPLVATSIFVMGEMGCRSLG
jgi:hypothetical protein